MLEDSPNRDLIERAEDLILRLREVRSARIYSDEEGRITEIHVVAETDRPAKLIARDVETCLKAALGVSVDYRKIGVVIMEPRKESQHEETFLQQGAPKDEVPPNETAGEAVDLRELLEVGAESLEDKPADKEALRPEAGLEFLEEDARLRFESITVTFDSEKVSVEVKLRRGDLIVTGSGSDMKRESGSAAAAASAAISAIAELVEEKLNLCLDGVSEVKLGRHNAICVSVVVATGREIKRYTGCALAGDDRCEAAALAVLDALNRPLGRWKLRREIRYRIT